MKTKEEIQASINELKQDIADFHIEIARKQDVIDTLKWVLNEPEPKYDITNLA